MAQISRKFMTLLVALAAAAVAQIQPAGSAADAGTPDQPGINWVDRYVTATGIGAPNPDQPAAARRAGAINAAQMCALRNALEMIQGITINSTKTIAFNMTQSDEISSQMIGFIKGFQQQGKTRCLDDGSVEVTMKIPLDGIGEKVLAHEIAESPSVTTFDGSASDRRMVYSGLIIDCRGLKVKPALSPKVVDESEKEIYGSAFVSRDWVVKYGIAGYSKDLQSATRLERVGPNPGQVKALKCIGDNNTDIVLSATDAADIRSAAENLKFLAECRVVFLID